ncbi:tubulinyl-Tyr carboxypeptidase 1 [Pimephales promelas]|uniref:tubulinyl-Tyr carboxypeptidase 1 n=1 Tax=Pimephales promelas TaxID=90988 RepID=UPI0019558A86|nr:tubulinyl-Tyr carboxypeptidase 1 [Pimephales promelas]KAG1936412.1 tubulinyl-Tyr carboxypeptidase [Pimephales promelas]
MPVSCCGALGPGSSPRRSVPGPAGVRACLGQPSASDGLKMLRSSFSLEGVEERDEDQEEDGEDQRDGGVPFIINRGGLPVNPDTWEQMWHHVTRIHPDGGALGGRIRGTSDLPKIPVPSVPSLPASASVPQRLEAIQRYIRDLQYNHTGTQFFEIKKSRPLTALMDIAKEMTRESLPIKCLEAVILGIYLTNSMPNVERFPLSFKTQFSGSYFRHIVLGVHSGGRFGALGISRRQDLMYKPLEFRTLSDLLQEFQAAYRGYWHTLCKVKIGHYVSHDPHSVEQIEWTHSVLDVDKLSSEELRKELERHTRDMRLKIGKAAPPSPPRDRRKEVGSPLRTPGSPMRKNSPSDRRLAVEKRAGPAADLNGYQIRV